MSLIARMEADLTAAMKERDNERRDALRLILSSLRSAEKELQRPLHDDEELQVLQRERKRRLESAEAFRAAGREEQAQSEEGRARGARGVHARAALRGRSRTHRRRRDRRGGGDARCVTSGRVMADVMPQIAGRADGSAVSQIVREKLA